MKKQGADDTRYSASKPTDRAIRAEKPSHTPEQTMRSSVFSSQSLSIVAGEIGHVP